MRMQRSHKKSLRTEPSVEDNLPPNPEVPEPTSPAIQEASKSLSEKNDSPEKKEEEEEVKNFEKQGYNSLA